MNHIKSFSVNLGNKTIQLPVADFQNKTKGKTIIITAGMDGDEYAGIKAAYTLCKLPEIKKVPGRIIIIPLVNIPGFENHVSANPLDGKFPKHICPGNQNGNQTEKLIHWIWSRYIKECDLWIDLHGGAIDEIISPFVWTYKTKNAERNKDIERIIKSLSSSLIIYENNSPYKKDVFLARSGIPYFILESGESGMHTNQQVKKHITWVREIIKTFYKEKPNQKEKKIYTQVTEYISQKSGMWHLLVSPKKMIVKNQLVGKIISLENKLVQKIYAKQNGIFLWGKEGLSVKKGDILLGLAHSPATT